jgi:hypothetical protein
MGLDCVTPSIVYVMTAWFRSVKEKVTLPTGWETSEEAL